jgi:hypothetical protein
MATYADSCRLDHLEHHGGDCSPIRAAKEDMTANAEPQRLRMKRDEKAVAPLTIGPRNAVDLTGVSWRWLRDNAPRLGVPVWRVRGKSVIPAAPLFQALEREAVQQESRALTDEEERERLRRELGMERLPQRSATG